MFVKKATKYWKEVTTTEEVEYTILYNGFYLPTPPVFAVKGIPEVGKKLYNLLNLDVTPELTYTFDIDTEESGVYIASIGDSYTNGNQFGYWLNLSEEVPNIGKAVGWHIRDSFGNEMPKRTQIETITVTQPATPDDYTYKEEELKQYAIAKRYVAHKQGDFKPDYAVTGSPTITSDGVVSGFSKSSFLRFTKNFTPASNPWEMVFKVTTGNVTTDQYIVAFGKGFTEATRYATRIGIYDDKRFNISVSYNGTAWDIVGDSTAGAKGSYTVLANTTYYLKFEFTGSAYKLSYSLDGVEYIQDCYVASTTPMYNANTANLIGVWYQTSYTSPFLGSIDLSESYIKINGEYFWSGFYPEDVVGTKAHLPIVKRWGKLDFQFEYESAGTYTVEIPHDGEYELTVVGGGAGGAFVYSARFWDGAAAGGSGGGFIGVTHLTKGTYTVTVGAGGAGNFNNNSATSCTAGYGGDSKFGDIVTAGGATAPTARYNAETQTGSIGGTVRYDVSDFSSVSLSSNGNTGYGSNQADGGTYAGGASVYEGYGAGGQAAHGACKAGTAGYVKIKAVNVYGYKETYY